MINVENQESPLPETPREAFISFILGLCSLLSLIPFAFLLNFIDHYPFPPSSFQPIFPYFLLLFIAMWMILPTFAVFSAMHAKKTSTGQTGQRMVTTSLVLSYISLLVIGGTFCSAIVLITAFWHFA